MTNSWKIVIRPSKSTRGHVQTSTSTWSFISRAWRSHLYTVHRLLWGFSSITRLNLWATSPVHRFCGVSSLGSVSQGSAAKPWSTCRLCTPCAPSKAGASHDERSPLRPARPTFSEVPSYSYAFYFVLSQHGLARSPGCWVYRTSPIVYYRRFSDLI